MERRLHRFVEEGWQTESTIPRIHHTPPHLPDHSLLHFLRLLDSFRSLVLVFQSLLLPPIERDSKTSNEKNYLLQQQGFLDRRHCIRRKMGLDLLHLLAILLDLQSKVGQEKTSRALNLSSSRVRLLSVYRFEMKGERGRS